MENMVKLISRDGCEKFLIDKQYGPQIILPAFPRSLMDFNNTNGSLDEALENGTFRREYRRTRQYLVTIYEEV